MIDDKAGVPPADESLVYLFHDLLLVQVDDTRRTKLYSNGRIRYNKQSKTVHWVRRESGRPDDS